MSSRVRPETLVEVRYMNGRWGNEDNIHERLADRPTGRVYDISIISSGVGNGSGIAAGERAMGETGPGDVGPG